MNINEAVNLLKQSDYIIIESVNINKDYLTKQAIAKNYDFKDVKALTNTFMTELKQGINISPSVFDKFANLLTLMNIKSDLKYLNDSFMHKLHDAILAKSDLPSIILQRTNSDSKPEDVDKIINDFARKAKCAYSGLTPNEIEIWERVKVYKDFGNYRWVYAVDKNGEIVGYMPQDITRRTMAHCGNQPSVQEGDEYWELRDPSNKAYLTVILNGGLIQEAKSYNNQTNKMGKEIYKYVEWFYKSDIVKGVGSRYDHGYATDKNFGATAIAAYDPSFLNWCEENKPKLIGDSERAIIEYKKYDKETLTNMYLDYPEQFGSNNWSIYLAAIGGTDNITLSEDDIIFKLIKPQKISLEVFANADVALLTERIQKAFVKFQGAGALKTLFDIAAQVNSFNICYKLVEYLYSKNKILTNIYLSILPEHKQAKYSAIFNESVSILNKASYLL